jgi:hypothetical protein
VWNETWCHDGVQVDTALVLPKLYFFVSCISFENNLHFGYSFNFKEFIFFQKTYFLKDGNILLESWPSLLFGLENFLNLLIFLCLY